MKKIYRLLTFALVTTSLYGCKKELNALPKNAKVDANTVVDQATAQIALNGAYYNFANATATKTGWQTHQLFPAQMAGYLSYGYGKSSTDENNTEALGGAEWTEYYKTVNVANGVIKSVSALEDAKFTNNKKKEILAESRFIRAYGHAKLLTHFAEWYKLPSKLGVLLRNELSVLSNINKPRSTVAESYQFIFEDLDYAIANAPATNPNHYATKWAAMALKMRILMMKGESTDYIEVINLADNLIANSGFVLEANVKDLFQTKALTSKEVILGIKPQALQASDFYSKSKQYYPGAGYLYVATAVLKDLLANDPRQSWMIGAANPSAQAPNTFYFTKYFIPGSTPSLTSETDYALRLTEVYLLKAEAIIRSGGSLATAKAIIHITQSKAGVTAANSPYYNSVEAANTPETLLIELYKETTRSMVAEDGIEWIALLRLPFTTVKTLKPTLTAQFKYIFGVPKDEFLYNPSFGDQNPGYSKN